MDIRSYIVMQREWFWKHMKLFFILSSVLWTDIAETNHTIQKDSGNTRAELLHVGELSYLFYR